MILYLRIGLGVLTGVCTRVHHGYMTNTATALLSGYRGSKVHAVDVEEPRNQNRYRLHGDAMSLCGWAVIVGDVEFKDLEFITCRNCAKAARNH